MTEQSILGVLKNVEESLLKLRAVKKSTFDEFLAKPDLQDIAKWNFYVVLQGCLDIGNHVIAKKRLPTPSTYEDIIKTLAAAGLIEKEIHDAIVGMAGFRNLLAHGYFKIDPKLLFRYLDKLGFIEDYITSLKAAFS